MLENTNGSHIGGAAWRAAFLAMVQTNVPLPELVRVFALEAGGPQFPDQNNDPDVQPRSVSMVRDNCLYLWIAGITNAGQGRSIFNGYISQPVPPFAGASNPWFETAANQIWRIHCQRSQDRFNRAIICGYSAGGAIAEYVSNLLTNRSNMRRTPVITFGQPQAFAHTGARRHGDQDLFRWMNADDPVPLIPPNEIASVFTWGQLTAANIRRICQFDHSSMGFDVDLQFRTTRRVMPTIAGLTPVPSVQAWLANQDIGVDSGHSIQVYAARLRTMVPLQPALPLAVIRNPPMPRHPQPAAREIVQHAAAVAGTIVSVARQQMEGPLIIPTQNLFIAVRVGKIWRVRFGGVDVAIAPFRRRARGLALAGNNFLRRLQREAVVSPEDLAIQFTAYLAAASDPESGFRPQLNTTVPPQ